MIRLLAHPSPRPPSERCLPFSLFLHVSPVELSDLGGGGLEPNNTTVIKLLHKSLNTLWGHRTTSLAELTDSPIWSPSVMKAVQQRLYLHNSYRSSVLVRILSSFLQMLQNAKTKSTYFHILCLLLTIHIGMSDVDVPTVSNKQRRVK
jgi:hypothetical protein